MPRSSGAVTVALAEGEAVNGKAADTELPAAPAGPEGTAKCKKRKKMKNRRKRIKEAENGKVEQEETVSATDAVLRTPEPKEEKEGEKVSGRVEETELPAADAPEGTPKGKKRKRRVNRRKRNTDAANAEENGTGEQEETVYATAAVLRAPESKEEKEEGKAKEMVMAGQEEEATATIAVSDQEGTLKCKKRKKKKKKAKETVVDEPEPSTVVPVLAVGMTKKHKAEGENGNETGLAEQETTAAVSASEGPRKHRRKKNKMQKQQESTLTLSGLVAVDVANKPGNGGTNREDASRDADVSMNPINTGDPCCSKAKEADDKVNCESQEGDKNCSEKFCSFQEDSEDSKTPNREKRKRKRDASQDISPQDGATDSNPCLDSSCLVPVHEEKVQNIFSPRGSLIRFTRKKLLILDLNGLLADITMDKRNEHLAHAKVKGKLVFRRPYYDDFLRFCFQHFELGIWSSRKMENVNSVVNILMPDLKQHLLFCWDMSKCTFTGSTVIGVKHKPLVLKELKKLWNKEDPYLPWEQGQFSPSNTLLVDDSPYKALCNPPHTAIFPQPYSFFNRRRDYSLGPGGDLRVYLKRLAAADDVQVFVRDNPFGQPSITESDPKWNFYAEIVRRVEQGLGCSGTSSTQHGNMLKVLS